jgi:hypothetical protein
VAFVLIPAISRAAVVGGFAAGGLRLPGAIGQRNFGQGGDHGDL